MSYNKELETDRQAKREHDENMKKNAADRLKANREYKQKRKFNGRAANTDSPV